MLQLAVSGASGAGIDGGDGCYVYGCKAHDNANGAITAGAGSTITDCTAFDNQGNFAISAGEGSTLTNCTASGNQTNAGINANAGCTLSNCTAFANQCADAISAGEGSTDPELHGARQYIDGSLLVRHPRLRSLHHHRLHGHG